MFSKAFAYALRATVYLVVHGEDNRKISLQEISSAIDVPHHFLGKIMQDLVRKGVINSMKGPTGGFSIHEGTSRVSPFEILMITEGPNFMNHCLMGKKNCRADYPCPLHNEYARARDQLLEAMKKTTLDDMAEKVESHTIFLEEAKPDKPSPLK